MIPHSIHALIYPHAPWWLIEFCGIAVCALNLAVYLYRRIAWLRRHRTAPAHSLRVNASQASVSARSRPLSGVNGIAG